jgi:hypothetical protein
VTEKQIPRRRDVPLAWLERRTEHLVAELDGLERARSRRRRRVVLVAIPALVALLVATGFTAYVLTREPTHLESIGCFQTADLRANTAIVAADGRGPVAICAAVWRQGGFGDVPAPERLAACVLGTGVVGVFPSTGAGTCARLGVAPLPASYAAEARRFAELRDAIIAAVGEPASGSSRGGPKCVHEQAARAAVRRELDAHGYGDWRIEAGGGRFTAERPCADVSFDSQGKAVILVPVARAG